MTQSSDTIKAALRELESVQSQVGNIQLTLLELIASDTPDDFGDSIQDDLLKLESVQRVVGETQKSLFMYLRQTVVDKRAEQTTAAIVELKPDHKPTSATPNRSTPVDPRAWLEKRGIHIKRVREESAMDGAADRVAQYLGDHFAELSGFYKAIKGRVSKSNTWRWYPVMNLSADAIKHVLKFGNMLHDSGYLTAFRYAKNDQHVQFDPLDDHRVTYFLTGGWLERYAFNVARNTIQNRMGGWSDDQALLGVEIDLPDGTATEFDLMVGMPDDRVLWIECKTGEWGDYIKHFQVINNKYLHLPQSQTALVLASELTDEGKASIGELAAMSVIHLSELKDWLTRVATEPVV